MYTNQQKINLKEDTTTTKTIILFCVGQEGEKMQ